MCSVPTFPCTGGIAHHIFLASELSVLTKKIDKSAEDEDSKRDKITSLMQQFKAVLVWFQAGQDTRWNQGLIVESEGAPGRTPKKIRRSSVRLSKS